MDTKGGKEDGRKWETGLTAYITMNKIVHTYILLIKQITNENLLYSTGNSI